MVLGQPAAGSNPAAGFVHFNVIFDYSSSFLVRRLITRSRIAAPKMNR